MNSTNEKSRKKNEDEEEENRRMEEKGENGKNQERRNKHPERERQARQTATKTQREKPRKAQKKPTYTHAPQIHSQSIVLLGRAICRGLVRALRAKCTKQVMSPFVLLRVVPFAKIN